MSKPTVRHIGTRQEFYWEKERVYAVLSRVHDHSDNRVTAEVVFKTDREDIPSHILHTQLNLLSTRTKKDIANELADRFPLPEDRWTVMVEQLCTISLSNHRRGKPAKEVWPVLDGEQIPQSGHLVHPLLYEEKPTILFGEGSTGKSYLALTLAILTQLPFYDNPLRLKPQRANALYLDYESDEVEFKRRLTMLQRGFNLGPFPVHYRECHIPLIEDIDHIEQLLASTNTKLLIIDSLGVASANGNLNDATTATAFYAALRRLKVTSLIITHTSKDEARKASPFGSVYFSNLARSIFEVRRQQEEETNKIDIVLIHRKNNQGALLAPQGFGIKFERDKTTVFRMQVESVPEFLDKLSLKARISHLLREEGKAPVKEIAEGLDIGENKARAILSRYKDTFVKVGNQWGLKSEEQLDTKRNTQHPL